MIDTILWTEESDAYTKRAIKSLGANNLFNDEENEWARNFHSLTQEHITQPKDFLDIGCAYGANLIALHQLYPKANMFGIDPGKESIEIAKKKNTSSQITFKVGHSHSLPIKDDSIDIVILSMVLQWVPRKHIIQTIAEVDRVLRVGGIVWLQEFLPNKPVTSVSHHNPDVRIFKDDYSRYFTVFPRYKEVYRKMTHIEEGEDQQRHLSLLRKYRIQKVFTEKDPAKEKTKV